MSTTDSSEKRQVILGDALLETITAIAERAMRLPTSWLAPIVLPLPDNTSFVTQHIVKDHSHGSFDWTSVDAGAVRVGLAAVDAPSEAVKIMLRGSLVGYAPRSLALLLHGAIIELAARGYEVKLDVWNSADGSSPRLMIASPSKAAKYLYEHLQA